MPEYDNLHSDSDIDDIIRDKYFYLQCRHDIRQAVDELSMRFGDEGVLRARVLRKKLFDCIVGFQTGVYEARRYPRNHPRYKLLEQFVNDYPFDNSSH